MIFAPFAAWFAPDVPAELVTSFIQQDGLVSQEPVDGRRFLLVSADYDSEATSFKLSELAEQRGCDFVSVFRPEWVQDSVVAGMPLPLGQYRALPPGVAEVLLRSELARGRALDSLVPALRLLAAASAPDPVDVFRAEVDEEEAQVLEKLAREVVQLDSSGRPVSGEEDALVMATRAKAAGEAAVRHESTELEAMEPPPARRAGLEREMARWQERRGGADLLRAASVATPFGAGLISRVGVDGGELAEDGAEAEGGLGMDAFGDGDDVLGAAAATGVATGWTGGPARRTRSRVQVAAGRTPSGGAGLQLRRRGLGSAARRQVQGAGGRSGSGRFVSAVVPSRPVSEATLRALQFMRAPEWTDLDFTPFTGSRTAARAEPSRQLRP